MTYIAEMHDHTPEPSDITRAFIAEDRLAHMKKQVQETVEDVVDEEFDRLVEYADEHLSEVAAGRATKFLRKVLDGDNDAAMALFGDARGTSRRQSVNGEPWASLIHGRLFETDAVALRRKIVEAHTDLLSNERIKDLESVVDGLTKQVRQLEKDRERAHGAW